MRSYRPPLLNNLLLVLFLISALGLGGLFIILSWLSSDRTSFVPNNSQATQKPLTIFAAAGLRYPLDAIADAYTATYGTPIQVQYGGSNTMLSQLEVGQSADLYIAADDFYTNLAAQKGLIKERIPIAHQTPVIVTQRGTPHAIDSIADLYRNKLRYALGDPNAAAIGKKTMEALADTDYWVPLKKHATVLKPTVNDIASAVSLGSVDAGIVWDSTAAQYDNLHITRDPLLDKSAANAHIAVTTASEQPTSALHFARFLTANDRGLPEFARHGFKPVQGDTWNDNPHITFYAGAVNRRAIEKAVDAFEQREGVRVNTIYNGCGILTAQMRALHDNESDDFPDSFMACDVYYMDVVQDLFMGPVTISDTDIVLVVGKGNPKNITALEDLLDPGVRVAIGQPRQCTIGVLTRRLLDEAGLSTRLQESGNIVTETTSSALLVPSVVAETADVALAYRADANAEKEAVEVISINSMLAKAIQPFGISKQSTAKQMNARLFDAISAEKESFLKQGFGWRLHEGERPALSAPKRPVAPVTPPARKL